MNIKKEVLMGNILLEALETEDACNDCFYTNESKIDCLDCFEFITGERKDTYCPCHKFTPAGARKLFWIALEERGII